MADLRQQLQSTLTGSYTIERELGGGGMSRVFLADETKLGRKVVVKVLAPELAAGISNDRFLREIKLAASLQQANIVPVLSSGDAQGLPYYTMPYVEGESLRKRLGEGTAPGITETVRILGDVARALSYAHDHGIVHRDIKPDNVLLSHGTAVVTDFGIAKAVASARTGDGAATLTQLGASIGTPAYMAPEQAAGDENIDHRVDIYAFGCLAYELLAGRPPFSAKTTQRMMAAQMSELPQPITELRRDTPQNLAMLVMQCLEKDPAARPQKAAILVGVLDSVSSGGLPSMPAVLIGAPAMFRRALGIYVVAFVAVAILARAAIIAIGLPDWVFPGALIVMALGLPVILFAGYAHRTTMRALTMTPSRTPGGTMERPSTLASIAIKAGPKLSWARVARGGYIALGAFVLVVGGFMTLRAAGIGPAGSLFGKGTLATNDRLLVGEFRSPGDTALGTVIAEALRQSLSESHAIYVASPTAVADGLRRMQKQPTERLDLSLAKDLAEREGFKAIVHGDVTAAAGGFILTARLTNAANGEELTSFREAARDATDLIPAVDRLARDLRGKIGESLKSIRSTPPLIKVTTASIPALRKYTEGMRLHYMDQKYKAAAKAFEEAITLDSTFAMAYVRAATSYYNTATAALRQDTLILRASKMLDRLPELEKQLIIAKAAPTRTAELKAYEAALAIDPNQSPVLNNMGMIYVGMRDYARGEATYKRAIALKDGNLLPRFNLTSALVGQGKFAEARALIKETEDIQGHVEETGLTRGAVAELVEGNFDRSQAMLEQATRMPRAVVSRASVGFLVNLLMARGQPAKAIGLRDSMQFADLAVGNRRTPVNPITRLIDSASTDIDVREDSARGLRRLDALVAARPLSGKGTLSPAQLLSIADEYAFTGRSDQARAMLMRWKKSRSDTLPTTAERFALMWLAINAGNTDSARRIAEAKDTAADGQPVACATCLPGDLAFVYDRAGQADSAIKYFEAYVNSGYAGRWTVDAWVLAHAYQRLGELYEAKNNLSKAGQYYQRYVNLRAHAEPDIAPKVAEIRRRLARISDLEKKR